ncbi:MAG: integrase, partial [Bacteroidota bacterium]
MTRAEARELARHILSHTKENNLVTNEHMLKIFERLYDYGGLLVYFEDNKLKKTTYYKYKSAYQYGAALKMRSLFSEADKVEKTDPEQARECRRQALALGEEVKKLSPDYEKAHRFLDNQDNSVIKPYSDDKISSKRKYLKGLPENWVGMIIDELPIMHQDAAVLMAVTGCRPAELENGVLLESVDEEYLKVTIKGAKYKKGKQGQKKRTVTLAGWFVPHLFKVPRRLMWNCHKPDVTLTV